MKTKIKAKAKEVAEQLGKYVRSHHRGSVRTFYLCPADFNFCSRLRLHLTAEIKPSACYVNMEQASSCWLELFSRFKDNNYDDLDDLFDYKTIIKEVEEDKKKKGQAPR